MKGLTAIEFEVLRREVTLAQASHDDIEDAVLDELARRGLLAVSAPYIRTEGLSIFETVDTDVTSRGRLAYRLELAVRGAGGPR